VKLPKGDKLTDREKMEPWFDFIGAVDCLAVKHMPSSVRIGRVRYSFDSAGELVRVQVVRSVTASGAVLYRTVGEA
jgi:hypothetical protein